MLFNILAQVPTPTYLPPSAPIPLTSLENAVDMWEMAPEAVGLWNQFRDYTPALQWMLAIIVLVSTTFLVMRLLQRFSKEDAL